MKIKDMFGPEFWAENGDVDICNDVTDEMALAFCGGLQLTDHGKELFKDVLDVDIMVWNGYVECLLDKMEGDVWEAAWDKINELFEYAAGYCSVEEYDKCFKEVLDAD